MIESFISDRGELLNVGSWGLPRHLQCRLDGLRAANYAMRNLGFIRLRHFQYGAHATWCELTVDPRALITLLQWAFDQQIDRIVVTLLGRGVSNSIIIKDYDQLARVVLTRLEDRHEKSTRDAQLNYFLRPREPAISPFKLAVERLYAGAASVSNVSELSGLCRTLFGNRFLLMTPLSQGRHFQIRACGDGYGFLPKGIGGMLPQMRIADAPDYYYGRWLNSSFNDVLASDKVAFDDVDAYIFEPKSGRQRFTYTRAIVPFMLPTGEKLLLSTSQSDSSIDLRFAA